MTDEIDIMQKALLEYKDAVRIKNMNQELLQHLGDSIFYLIKHSEKYNLPLPKKDELIRMVDRANYLIGQITEPTNRQLTRRNTTDKLPEPDIRNCYLVG